MRFCCVRHLGNARAVQVVVFAQGCAVTFHRLRLCVMQREMVARGSIAFGGCPECGEHIKLPALGDMA